MHDLIPTPLPLARPLWVPLWDGEEDETPPSWLPTMPEGHEAHMDRLASMLEHETWQAGIHRRECAAYSACLARAAAERWPGMSCAACEAGSLSWRKEWTTELPLYQIGIRGHAADELVDRSVLWWLKALRRGLPLPHLAVTAESDHLLDNRVLIAAADEVHVRALRTIRVGVAPCPSQRHATPEYINRRGYCRRCGAHLVAVGPRVVAIKGRDTEQRQERGPRRKWTSWALKRAGLSTASVLRPQKATTPPPEQGLLFAVA